MTEHVHPGPREIVDRALALLLAHDMAGFARLWAGDGTMEFPFAPEGYPQRLDGRAAVAEYVRDYTDHIDVRAIAGKTVHQTLDPDVAIVEFETEGIAVRTGRAFRMRYIAVVTVRDGEIVSYRDYWSPQAGADALGGADGLAALGNSDGDR